MGTGKDQTLERSQGRLSANIHAAVDALGNPASFHLTPRQASDFDGADALLPAATAPAVIADKVYDAQARLIDVLMQKGPTEVISPTRSRMEKRA